MIAHGLALLLLLTVAGPSAAQTPTATLAFAPLADTYVDGGAPSTNFNTDARLRTDLVPERIAYLRFAVSGVQGRPVFQARLRLGVSGASSAGGTIHRIFDGTWDEATVTWNTRPAVDGPPLHTLGRVAIGSVVEFNLDGAVTGDGVYDLAIDTAIDDAASYVSSAATSGQKPVLVLTVAAGPEPVVRIVQPLPGASFFVGDPITLQGTALDDVDGDLSGVLAWVSNAQGFLGTGAALVGTLAEGAHTITAVVKDGDGLTGSASVSITVAPRPAANTAPLVSIAAPQDGAVFGPAEAVGFAGTASDLEDGALTARLAWSSDLDGVLGSGGAFSRVLRPGTHRITARATDSRGLVGTATVTVTVRAGTTVELPAAADTFVDAGLPSTNFGGAAVVKADANTLRIAYLRFVVHDTGAAVARAILRLQVDAASAAASDRGGSVYRVSDTAWDERLVTFASRPAVDPAALATSGRVTAGQVVDFDVTAAIAGDGVYGFAIMNSSSDGVDYRSREGGPAPRLILSLAGNAPAVAVTAPADGTSVPAGALLTFAAGATDAEDGDLSAAVAWGSSLDGPLGVGARLATAALRAGTHTITAAVVDSDGLRGQAQVHVVVRAPNTPPTITMTAPAPGTMPIAGVAVTLAGSALDTADGDLSAALLWSSSLQGALGRGPSILATLVAGTHMIAANVTDSGGLARTVLRSLTVLPASTDAPPSLLIVAPRDGRVATAGEAVTLVAIAEDREDGLLMDDVSWHSDRDGPLGVGGDLTRTFSLGVHRISAAVTDRAGQAATATVTVHVLASTSLAFTATADTYVDSRSPSTSFGRATRLAAQTSPDRVSYLRFVLNGMPGGVVAQARLRLTVRAKTSDGSAGGGTVYAISNTSWAESTTTWANRPLVDGPALASRGRVVAGEVVEFDVTPAIRGDGAVSFALVSTSTDEVRYRSRENSTGKPQLVLSFGSPRVTLAGTVVASYRNVALDPDTVIDARAATFLGSTTDSYPLDLGGGPGVWLLGGAVRGQYARTLGWDAMHLDNNAAVVFDNPELVVDGLRIDNVTDGIRPKNGGSFAVRNVRMSYVRDDCIENDHLVGGLVDDSLLDGCYAAFSARPSGTIMAGGANGAGQLWRIQRSLVRLEPMPGPDGGSVDGLGHNGFFKWHSWDDPSESLSPKLALHDNVFMAERVGQAGAARMGIPPGQLASCANNVMVWLGPGDYPAPLPACFTVTRNRAVWDAAVADWIQRHPHVQP